MLLSDILLITHHSVIWIWILAACIVLTRGSFKFSIVFPIGILLGLIGPEDIIYSALIGWGFKLANPQVVLCYPFLLIFAALMLRTWKHRSFTPWLIGISISGAAVILTTLFFHLLTVGYLFDAFTVVLMQHGTPDALVDFTRDSNYKHFVKEALELTKINTAGAYVCSYNDIANTPYCLTLTEELRIAIFDNSINKIHNLIHIVMYSLCLVAHSVWVFGSFVLIRFHLDRLKQND